jgi:heme-degrading monooxygenase HmoA
MPVLIRHRPAGMTAEMYDQVAPALIESIKQQPGFILHTSFTDADGFCVAEVWDSQEQHDAWFNTTVVPNVPTEISQEVIEVHSLHQP